MKVDYNQAIKSNIDNQLPFKKLSLSKHFMMKEE